MQRQAKFGDWLLKNRYRCFSFFMLLMVLPIVAFTFSVGRVLRHQTERQAVTETAQIGRLTATLVDEHFRQSAAFLDSFASRPLLKQAWARRDMAAVQEHLEQASRLRPDFVFFSIYDLDGTLRGIFPAHAEVVNSNFAYRDWYQGVSRNHGPYVSVVYQTAVSPKQLVVATAVALKDDYGRTTGYLMAPFAVDTISRWLAESKLDGSWTISLLDQTGQLAAHPAMDPFAAPVNLSAYPPAHLVQTAGEGNGVFARDGQTFFTRYVPIPQFGWTVLVEQSFLQLQLGSQAVEHRVWFFGVIFLLIGVGVSLLMGWLYSQLEVGNRFINLSVDLFCVAGSDGYFKRLSPAWKTVLGFTTSELTAKPYLEFIHPEDRDATQVEKQRLENGDLTLAFENRYLCKDGSYKWLLWNAVCEPEENLIYAVARDITERKRVQQQIEQQNRELELRNREVEHATQLKSKFLASMSHELRTPLNAIVGFSGLLAEETAGTLNDKQKRFVGHIKQGADHLLQLINDILDLSKIEAGQLEMRCEDFCLEDALPEVLSTIRPLAMAKNIRVAHELKTHHQVYADRVRVKQVLYNLLSNAVKFTPRDGHINVDCRAEDLFVCVSVTDNGIGIRPEDQNLVFEEFRQLQEGNGSANQGTGLGLAITKRLVERQGGRIFLKSEPGSGSCFTFTVPASGAAPNPKPESAFRTAREVADSSLRKPLVLIVDDETAARELMASYLEPAYRTVTACSSGEALEKARQLQPDAITLDVLMAGGSGFETLVSLRKIPETANIPVIIVSVVDQRRVGFALGAADYLIKPIHKPALLEAIGKCTSHRADASVLVVDDDSATLELLENTLRSAGYRTHTAQDGAAALAALSSLAVSAILLDLLMPDMDGFQVIQRVRQVAKLKDTPILVMTGKNLSAEEMAVLSRETQALFQKNGSWPQALLEEIGKVIRNRKLTKAVGQS